MKELNKIYNEDCFKGIREVEDKSIDLILTDPPYLFVKGGMKSKFNTGKMKPDSFINESMSDFGEKEITALCESLIPKFKHNYNAYFFCSEMQIVYYLNFAVKHKLRYNVLIWDRQQKTMISKKFFRSGIDYIIRIYGSGNSLVPPTECSSLMDLYSKIKVAPQGTESGHPTEKPISVITDLMLLSSKEGDVILDPFMGSGTTAIAAIKSNRNFIGFELNEEYFNIANERIEKFLNEK